MRTYGQCSPRPLAYSAQQSSIVIPSCHGPYGLFYTSLTPVGATVRRSVQVPIIQRACNQSPEFVHVHGPSVVCVSHWHRKSCVPTNVHYSRPKSVCGFPAVCQQAPPHAVTSPASQCAYEHPKTCISPHYQYSFQQKPLAVGGCSQHNAKTMPGHVSRGNSSVAPCVRGRRLAANRLPQTIPRKDQVSCASPKIIASRLGTGTCDVEKQDRKELEDSTRKPAQHEPLVELQVHASLGSSNATGVTIAPNATVGQLKDMLIEELGLDAGDVCLQLASGTDVLLDHYCVSELYPKQLQAVIIKKASVELIGPEFEGDDKYCVEGVVAPNGCVYFAPERASHVLVVTPDSGEVRTIGSDIYGVDVKYRADGVLAGTRIFFAPSCANKVLCIHSETDEVELIGPAIDGEMKYLARGCLAPNNMVYFAPACASQVLCINSHTLDVELIGPALEGPFSYGANGVVASNGCIYFAPWGGTRVLCVDSTTQSVQLIGPEIERNRGMIQRYLGSGVVTCNGDIFFAPTDSYHVLRVCPKLQEVFFVGPELYGSVKYADGVLSRNGSIYFAPYNADRVLRICPQPETYEIEHIGDEIEAGEEKYDGAGVQTPDGRIYWAPGSAGYVLCVDSASATAHQIGPRMEGAAKFCSKGVFAENGQIFFAPRFANRVLHIDPRSNLVELVGPALGLPGLSNYDTAASVGQIFAAPSGARRVLRIDP